MRKSLDEEFPPGDPASPTCGICKRERKVSGTGLICEYCDTDKTFPRPPT